MNNKLSRILSCLLLGACVSCTVVGSAAAAPASNDNTNQYCTGQFSDIHVADANSFAVAVSNACAGATIVLDSDILLSKSVEIRSSILLDLNGYSINLSNGAELTIGAKVFSHTEYYNVEHPGYYIKEPVVSYESQPDDVVYDDNGNEIAREPVKDKKNVTYQDVWVPGWTETKSRDVYDYLDGLDVVVKDGWVHGADGKNGSDGIENTFTACDGKDGGDGSPAIRVVSGTLRISKIDISGGNGGNGGDGRYQAILHIPFFTGHGGDGGKGGNAGSAVVLERNGAHLIKGKSVNLNCGAPGKGGKGSEPNTNHWVGKGKHGLNGKDGKKVIAVKQ